MATSKIRKQLSNHASIISSRMKGITLAAPTWLQHTRHVLADSDSPLADVILTATLHTSSQRLSSWNRLSPPLKTLPTAPTPSFTLFHSKTSSLGPRCCYSIIRRSSRNINTHTHIVACSIFPLLAQEVFPIIPLFLAHSGLLVLCTWYYFVPTRWSCQRIAGLCIYSFFVADVCSDGSFA